MNARIGFAGAPYRTELGTSGRKRFPSNTRANLRAHALSIAYPLPDRGRPRRRNGNLNPPDVYPKDIWVPLQNQANRVGMVLTAESR